MSGTLPGRGRAFEQRSHAASVSAKNSAQWNPLACSPERTAYPNGQRRSRPVDGLRAVDPIGTTACAPSLESITTLAQISTGAGEARRPRVCDSRID
jgi:hypothetical protein